MDGYTEYQADSATAKLEIIKSTKRELNIHLQDGVDALLKSLGEMLDKKLGYITPETDREEFNSSMRDLRCDAKAYLDDALVQLLNSKEGELQEIVEEYEYTAQAQHERQESTAAV